MGEDTLKCCVSFQVKTGTVGFLTYKLQHAGCCQQGNHTAGVDQHIISVERAKSHLQGCKGNRVKHRHNLSMGQQRTLNHSQTPSLHTLSMVSVLPLYLDQTENMMQ